LQGLGKKRIINAPMDNITCPHCGKKVEISHVLKLQIEAEVTAASEAKHKKEIEDVKATVLAESEKKLKNKFELQLKQAAEDALEKEERNRELMERLDKMMDEMRELRKEKDNMKLEMKQKLAEDEDKIRADAQKKAEEEQQLKILEKDKQLQLALKEVEEMRRKLQQGSQQAQGEVFEEQFEKALATQYPNDKIDPVGKGIRGGDVIQEVWDSRGNYVGKILWELKNTKTWSEGWIDKLKADQRTIKAEEAVIITLAMPPGMKMAGFRNQVWVTGREFVIPLADSLRAKLIQLFYVKASVQGKDQKIEILYNYLSGTEFKHRVEAIVEAFSNMQAEIEKEKRYFMNKWARDEKNIRQVIDSTYGMHGDLKGIIGSSLPAIAGIEDESLGEGLDDTSEIITRRDGISLTLKQKVKVVDNPPPTKKVDESDDEVQTLF
jgi:hypothetical protein